MAKENINIKTDIRCPHCFGWSVNNEAWCNVCHNTGEMESSFELFDLILRFHPDNSKTDDNFNTPNGIKNALVPSDNKIKILDKDPLYETLEKYHNIKIDFSNWRNKEHEAKIREAQSNLKSIFRKIKLSNVE